MIYRELGSSGIEVSAIGSGAWAIGGWMWGGRDDQKSLGRHPRRPRLRHHAHRHGPRLRLRPQRRKSSAGPSPDGGEQVVLATKCGLIWDREEGTFFTHADETAYLASGRWRRRSCPRIRTGLDPRPSWSGASRGLGTDHVDLYQTHGKTRARPSPTPWPPC